MNNVQAALLAAAVTVAGASRPMPDAERDVYQLASRYRQWLEGREEGPTKRELVSVALDEWRRQCLAEADTLQAMDAVVEAVLRAQGG